MGKRRIMAIAHYPARPLRLLVHSELLLLRSKPDNENVYKLEDSEAFTMQKKIWKHMSISAIFVWILVWVKQYRQLDCNLDGFSSVSLMDLGCKQYLELPPSSDVNCSRIIRGDTEAIEEALYHLQVDKRHFPPTEDEYLNLTKNCKRYKNIRKFITVSESKEEEEFPIAFSMVIHEKIEMFERLLRAIYRPHNIYCVHVDEKSPGKFKEAVRGITACFDNVFVASKLERVVYASWLRVQADLNCMEDLLKSHVQWKYLLNTCGTDFPIKTNVEMVKILTLLNGKNSMESEPTPEHKKVRWLYQYHITEDIEVEETGEMKEPPPDGIQMFSGNAYVVITRGFVKALFHDPKVQRLIEWEKDTYSPDEHLWATLHRMVEVPGSTPTHSKYDTSDLQAIARLVKWGNHAGDLKEGAPYEHCHGAYVRGICTYGTGDLPWMLKQQHLFANKFDSTVDNIAIQCLEQYLRHKTLYGIPL